MNAARAPATDAPPPRTRTRGLLPREHGAWVQLALPPIAALAAGEPTWVAAGLVATVALAFLSHEPLLVWLGHRGARARAQAGARALRLLTVTAGGSLAAGIATWLAAAGDVRLASLAFLVPAAAVAPLVLRRAERSTAGEIGVALALAGVAPAVALASGLEPRAAWLHGAVWAAVFASQTLAARGVLALGKKRAPRSHLLVAAVAVATAALGAAVAAHVAGFAGWGALAALAPPAALVAALAVRRPPPRRLMAIGLAMALVDAPIVALLALAPL